MQTFPFFSSKGNTAWKEPLNGIWESGWRLRFDYTPIVYLYNCRYMCAYFECMFLERGFWTASEENDQRLVDVCDYTHKISTHNIGLKIAITPNPKHEKRLPSAIWTKEIPRGKSFSFGQKVPDLSFPHAGFWPFPWWEHWFYLTQMHRGQTSERTPERGISRRDRVSHSSTMLTNVPGGHSRGRQMRWPEKPRQVTHIR